MREHSDPVILPDRLGDEETERRKIRSMQVVAKRLIETAPRLVVPEATDIPERLATPGPKGIHQAYDEGRDSVSLPESNQSAKRDGFHAEWSEVVQE